MGTISAALSLITGALDADQSALDVVSNNVANASNTTYTRQVPNWSENQPVYVNGMSVGTGVTMTGGVSQRDRVLNQRLQQQQQASSAATSLLGALTTLESSFTVASTSATTGGNIGTDITSFFDSYTQLESNPSSNSLRQEVLSTATILAGDISAAATNVSAQRSSLDQSVGTIAAQVNALTSSVATVNLQIQSLSPGTDAGALEDQRQSDLTQLSKLIGVNQIATENNGMSLTTAGGQLLVSEGTSLSISTGVVNGVTHFFAGGNDITSDLTQGGGQLGGLLTARDQSLPAALAALDQLAYGISTQVNTVNNAGTDLAGDNGNAGDIFSAPTQVAGTAAGMSVVMTDPNHIAAAALNGGVGDNSNAVAAAGLATQSIVGGLTPSNFYSNLISTIGSGVQEATIQNTALSASVSQLQTQVNSLSAVSLNDEASAMQEFERSYQAASQVFTILNTLAASAINLGVETAAA